MPGPSTPPPAPTAALVAMREVPADMAANLRAASNRLLGSVDDIQMHDVAQAAGVARSSLYYYFANKDEVVAFLLKPMLDELAEATTQASAGPGTPSERLLAVVRSLLEHFDEHPAAAQRLVANLGRVGKLPDIAAGVYECFEAPVRALLAEGASDGTPRPIADEGLVATALFGAVLVIGLKALVAEGRIDVDRCMELIGSMFRHAIAPQQAP